MPYLAFARHCAAELASVPDPGYTWPFQLQAPPAWVPAYLRNGSTLAEASRLLGLAAAHLTRAMHANDSDLALEAVSVIMDWGGVWFRQGPRSGNQQAVEDLHDLGQLVATVAGNLTALAQMDSDGVTHMNAGWTKVYAARYPSLVIYDSRVSSWIARQVLQFRRAGGDPRGILPDALRQTAGRTAGRHVRGYPECPSQPHYWARAMLKTAQVLAEIRRLGLQDPAFTGAWFAGLTQRELEARLFTLGA
jgi:hypothetical protein